MHASRMRTQWQQWARDPARIAAACNRISTISRHITRATIPGGGNFHPCAVVCRPASFSSSNNRSSSIQVVASSDHQVKPFQPTAGAFRIHRITGDGSCMFRAVVQGVHQQSKSSPMSIQSEGSAAHNLRLAIVKEMRTRRSEIEPFIAGITDDWDAYLERMEHPAAWGGEPEMVMAVNVIHKPITVYRPVGGMIEPIVTYGEDLLNAGVQPVHLLWSGAHYDLLVPREVASAA